jgi:hypothetical protein
MHPFTSRGPRAAALAFVVAALAGCGGGDPKMKPCFPVEGALFVKGKPATGATVTFHPLPLESGMPKSIRPRGTVDADGKFKLTTYRVDDGAPEGEYAVTAYWPGKRRGKVTEESESADLPPDQLGFRYQNPAKSTFKVTIKAPKTTLDPFQIP